VLIVFDLDGTLVDSRLDIAAATNHALVASGRSPLSVRTISGFVGDGARSLLARASGLSEDATELDGLLAIFSSYYTEHATVHTRPLPHALALLDVLGRELPLALCTNKPRASTLRVLSGLGIEGAFAMVSAGGDQPERKPHAAPLLRLTQRLGVAPTHTLLVGDGPQDVATARSAGATSVAVLGGFTSEATLRAERPDHLIGSLAELPPLLYRLRLDGVRPRAGDRRR